MLYWLLKSVVLGPVLRTLFRPWVRGLEHVPTAGPAILVSNHLSFSDSFFLPLVVPRRITFLAKADYFTGTGVKGRLTAGFFRGVGQVPVDRAGGQAGEAALRTGLKVLARGELLGVYPEGTRSPDGRLYRGKTGVARMALEGHVPVIPVVMVGTDRVQPIGRKVPSIRQVGVSFGPPLDFSRYEGMESDRFVLRSITDEIMYELMRLSGQEYVDVYAATMKEQLAEAVRERVAEVRARTERLADERLADVRARAERLASHRPGRDDGGSAGRVEGPGDVGPAPDGDASASGADSGPVDVDRPDVDPQGHQLDGDAPDGDETVGSGPGGRVAPVRGRRPPRQDGDGPPAASAGDVAAS